MKKIVKGIVAASVIILLFLVILLAGFLSNVKKDYKMDLIVKSTDSEFWHSVYKGASACADKYGIELNYMGPLEEADYREQPGIFEDSIAGNPDAVILAAGDYYLMSGYVRDSKVPVVMIDSMVEGRYGEGIVMTNNYDVGASLAREVMKRFGRSGNIGVINFVATTSTAIDRWDGFRTVIENESDLDISDIRYCEADIDISQQQTYEILETNPDIDILVGLNAQSTVGIARALESLGEGGKDYFVGGVDCILEEADYIEKGYIDATILQNPYMMGYYSVEKAYYILEKKKYEKETYVETYVIDKVSLFHQESQELIFPFD